MKTFWLALMAGMLVSGAQAFSLLGPYMSWQVPAIGYGLTGDIGGPMRLSANYRWNITNVFYAMDSSFLGYFGLRGEQEIDKAFAILNALTNASAMSANLDEYPLTDMLRENYLASALGIWDIKSAALEILVEQLGLADPIRYTWTLRARNTETFANVTITNYNTVKLNYDPVTLTPSSYVNGSLYSYNIFEPIPLIGGADYADAVEVPLDTVPYGNGDPTPVASRGALYGQYWMGLTRDDVGGLRWLLQPNNWATETIIPGSLVAATNRTSQVVLTNQDLRTLIRETTRTTNDTAAVLTLYPDLRITSSNSFLSAELQTNRFWILTNDFSSPTGHVQFVSDINSTNIVALYNYTYDNVVTNVTNGSFYIIPPNLLDYQVVTNLLTNVVPVTNLVFNPGELFQIDTSLQLLLTNYDLGLFLLQTTDTTNDSAALLTYYPDLIITGSNRYYSLLVETNLAAYFTNAPFAPHQITVTNIVTNAVPRFNYEFANVFTNVLLSVPIESNGIVILKESTNVFILPTNYVGYQLVSNLFFQSVTNAYTNVVQGLGWFIDYKAPTLIFSSNLFHFNEIARTNSSTNLLTFFPDLVVTNSSYTFGVQAFTNYFFYLTNPPYAPAGALMPAFYTEVTNVIVTNYTHSFANVVTNNLYLNAPLYEAQEQVYKPPFAPAGSLLLRTNWAYRQIGTITNGDYYIVPTNLVGYQLISTLLTNTIVLTNLLQPAFATNFAGTNVANTNLTSSTNILFTNTYLLSYGTNYVFSAYAAQPDPGTNYFSLYTNHYTAIYGIQSLTNGTNSDIEITTFTNVISAAYTIEFQPPANSVNIRPGVDKIHFINATRNYDSLIGQFFMPITNQFVENVITNSQMRQQVVRRVLGEPDILFISADLGLFNGLIPWSIERNDTANWINNDTLNGASTLGGPGVITPQVQISFTDQFPYYLNRTPFLLSERGAVGGFVWGSFDGSTNLPVVYPNYLSIQELEDEILHPPPPPPP